MDLILLIVGLSLIGLGFLVKRYPNLVAGDYETSDDPQKSWNVQGLSSFLRNALVIIGIVVATLGPVLGSLGMDAYVSWWFFAIVAIGTGVILVQAQTYLNS